MELVEVIVYGTVWAALACYPAAGLGSAAASPGVQRGARLIWSLGCFLFWVHVLSAFGAFYRWSHSVALAETAKQTLAATGVSSGSGLYLNYLFALFWAADVAWWWWRPESYRARPLGLFLLLHAFFLFMIVNGAVIFVPGPRRWLGLILTMAGVASVGWAVARQRKRGL